MVAIYNTEKIYQLKDGKLGTITLISTKLGKRHMIMIARRAKQTESKTYTFLRELSNFDPDYKVIFPIKILL